MRHPEFEKIHSDFLAHYSSDPAAGESRYAGWIKALGLDESKSYREQAAQRLGLKESFRWGTVPSAVHQRGHRRPLP